jgi:D-3-phosphoglycerate dehydrogenase
MRQQLSFPKARIRILLLEGIHPAAEENLRAFDYSAIDRLGVALPEEELVKAAAGVHILGIRSKTEVNDRIFQAARRLLAVGCFCIGTDQVDLEAATRRGVAVFNAPFSNTRSVAELTIAEVVMLARQAAQRSMEMHAGRWQKSAKGCVEVRQKTIGIVGYGHIGPQVGLLAEALGMKVVFYDIAKTLPLGNARQAASLGEVLKEADFLTLHVPDTPMTRNMIGYDQISIMRKGSFLLNLSRGTVVDVKALRQALVDGLLGGAAVDVYPEEPESSGQPFTSELQGLPNVILTPHIGGSTEEAQHNIGIEVAESLIKYVDTGSSSGCVNLPQVELPLLRESHRVLNIHRDVPGVLSSINGLVASMGVNIRSQYLNTRNGVGYLIMDVERNLSRAVKKKIDALDTNIRTRLLF